MYFLTGNHTLWAACLAALLAAVTTCCLAACLTPRAWWQRPSLLSLVGLSGTCCLLGWGLWQWLAPQTAAPAMPAIPAPVQAANRTSVHDTKPYRTHQALNLRQQPGTDAALRATLPIASRVWPTGLRQGDWWQVRSEYGTGWVSSLWLRQHARPE